MEVFLFGGWGKFESHCLIESFPSFEELPKVLNTKGLLFLPLKPLHFSNFVSVSCTIHALGPCCVALQVVGRKRRMQMKYELSPLSVWLSPTLLAPLLFNVAPLPLSQPAAGLASGCESPTQPLINQTHTHKHLYPSPPMMKHPPCCISCCCSVVSM